MAEHQPLIFSVLDPSPDGQALLTLPGGMGIYRKGAELRFETKVPDEGQVERFSATVLFTGCSFQLDAQGDLFLQKLLPGAQSSQDFDFGVAWDSEHGVALTGTGGLEITIPLQAKLPFLKLHALHLIGRTAAQPGGSDFDLELSADFTASLMAIIDVAVERLGLTSKLYVTAPKPSSAVPIAGPLSAAIEFKAPTGAGLALNVPGGVLSGGGFLGMDTVRGQYSGTMSLSLLGLGVSATGLIDTRPDFSLLTIFTANFKPVGLDVGFGFTINAVGGILGLNRGCSKDALRDGIRTNAIGSVLFPADPVANAPRIISDLGRFFPVMPDQFLLGPMIEMGWGKPAGMISVSLGLIVEIPDPKIVLLGCLKVLVPPGIEDAPLRLQANFLAVVDLPRRFLSLDGTLYDSRLLFFTLEGDMAARLTWGPHADLAVAVGGFHPRYTPAADLEIGTLKRIAVNLLPTEDNPRLRMESYYALTSNTLQHGARVEAYAGISVLDFGVAIHGFLGYDLLIQASPFRFIGEASGAVAVLVSNEPIMSLGFKLLIEGPNPFHVRGVVSFEIGISVLSKDVEIPVEAIFGARDVPALPDVDVAAKLLEQMNEIRNWSAVLPGQNQLLVSLRNKLEGAADAVLAHPSGILEFSQRTVPLNLHITRFGAANAQTAGSYSLVGFSIDGVDLPREDPDPSSEFSAGQFVDLTDEQRLSTPSFQRFPCGLRTDKTRVAKFPRTASRANTYDIRVRDPDARDPEFLFIPFLFPIDQDAALQALQGGALARSSLYQERIRALPSDIQLSVAAERFVVVDATDLTPVAGLEPSGSHAEAQQWLRQAIAGNPNLIVIAEHELSAV